MEAQKEFPDGVQGVIWVHTRGIGKAAAYFLLGFSAYILIVGLRNNPLGSHLASFFLCLVLVVPTVLLAEYVCTEHVIDRNGVIRIGLFGRQTRLAWDRVDGIELLRHSPGIRVLVVKAGTRKQVISNSLFLIAKPNFWEAAFFIIDRADASGWTVKTGFSGRSPWFFHGSTYLPGDKFEDRKNMVNGPSDQRSGFWRSLFEEED